MTYLGCLAIQKKKKIMKNCFLILLILIFFGCSSDEETTPIPQNDVSLVGTWIIFEQESDNTGFKPINSDRVIEFLSNNTVGTNGDLCVMTLATSSATNGVYNSISDISAFDGEITPDNCNDVSVYYKVNGNILTLYYQCSGACAQRFFKQ